MNNLYRCKVLDAKGRTRYKERWAESEEALTKDFLQVGCNLITAKPKEIAKRKKLPLSRVLEFTQSLHLLFAQNLSLKDSIQILSSLETHSSIRGLVLHVSIQLEKGKQLAAALLAYKTSFPVLYLGLIRVGELTGNLQKVLAELVKYLTDLKKLREKLLNSLIYPAIIVAILLAGMVLLSTLAMPTFLEIAKEMEGLVLPAETTERAASIPPLPTHTNNPGIIAQRIQTFQSAFITILLFLPTLVVCFLLARKNKNIRRSIDRMLLAMPPFRSIFLTMEMQNFCFAMGVLIESGYTIDAGLSECSTISANTFLNESIKEISEKTRKGYRLSMALKESRIFPPTFWSWVGIGEGAGDLREVFKNLLQYYSSNFDKIAHRISSVIEPGLIILTGLILVLVVVQFILPIFGLLRGG